APAYLVNDIYKRYINPKASNKRLIHASYAVSVGVVVISTIIGLYVQSINSVLQWLVSGLWGGYVVSNILKWYWWRLNGHGYFYGMMAGLIGALLFPVIFDGVFPDIASDILPLYLFPMLLVLSLIGCIAGSYLTPVDDMQLLQDFYKKIRPWGFWGPVRKLVEQQDPDFVANPHFKRDMFNVMLGIIAQTCLVALPIFIVIKDVQSGLFTLVVLAVSGFGLKKYWYDTLED
ncbi:MAG: sodium:solute symporter, partial [Psychrosphaera sp.]|nr:sodium:solute symporter [Psychrosphaera sp.]